VLVIHENRGLNPYVEDVARRAALDGFLALAPDGLSPVGGYPGNDDDGRTLQAGLEQPKLLQDMLNSARWLKANALSTGRLGVTGFCWGGGTTNWLATQMGADVNAGAPYYGAAPDPASVARIRAPMLIHYAENDERINAGWPKYEEALKAAKVRYEAFVYPGVQHGFNNDTTPGYEAALKAAGAAYERHVYPGTQHGFHNNSTPRFHEPSAKLSWDRTVAFFRRHLA
jgi:carboxymethylenebutenolidase